MKVLAAFFLILGLTTGVFAENYCSDSGAIQQWEALSAKYPQDDTIQTLHALWIGLCVKVKKGELEEQRAIDLFEKARAAAIAAKKAEKRIEERQKKTHL